MVDAPRYYENLFVDVYGSLGDHLANISCTSHSCFELHSVGVMNWVHPIHKSLFSSKSIFYHFANLFSW